MNTENNRSLGKPDEPLSASDQKRGNDPPLLQELPDSDRDYITNLYQRFLRKEYPSRSEQEIEEKVALDLTFEPTVRLLLHMKETNETMKREYPDWWTDILDFMFPRKHTK